MSAGESEPRLGPRAKVERAKEHLAEFERAVVEFLSRQPYALGTKIDPDGSHHCIIHIKETVPLRLSTVAGDVLHNARSALDLMACCLVAMNGGGLHRVQFPVLTDRAHFKKAGLKELLQPYKGRNSSLVWLHALIKRDKHRLIVPVGACPAFTAVAPNPGGAEPFRIATQSTEILEDGQIILSVSGPAAKLHENMDIPIRFEVRLSGVKGLPPLSARRLLEKIVGDVDHIVRIAERKLF
jgi:hypothetical protein